MSELKQSYYAVIPANVRYNKKLNPNAKLLYGEITALANEKGYCWAGNVYFSELYEVSTVSISKWIRNLIDNGYIESEIIYQKGTKNIEERRLYINAHPIKEKFNTSQRKVNDPIKEKFNTPIKEKFKDNITLINNTINNVIEYLNLKANKKFRLTESNKKPIRARLKEGFKFDDFKEVIDKKVESWLNDTNMNTYLRPSTLFGTKFESYLNESVSKPVSRDTFYDDIPEV